MSQRFFSTLVGLASAVLISGWPVFGAAFTPGNLVIYRVGDGAAALSANATPVFLDEYTPAGMLVQTIPMPTTLSGSNHPLVAGGTANSEGLPSRSVDGRYFVLGGYDAVVGVAVTTATARVFGRVDAFGIVDTTTAVVPLHIMNGNTGMNAPTAVATPSNDALTMIMMAVPLCILYLGSIYLVAFIERLRERRAYRPSYDTT